MDVVSRLQYDRDQTYNLYWNRVGDGQPHQAMLFFTVDGALIAGVAVPEWDTAGVLAELAGTLGAKYGLVLGECLPPDTADGFVQMCLDGQMERLADGKLFGDTVA